MSGENCEKSEKPVIYECPSCGSDETPQRHHFGGPKDGRNKECSCSSCSYQGLIEEFRIEWHYCVLCGDKYRDAEDLGLHLVRYHDTNEDTAGDDSYEDRVRSEAEKRDTCDNGHCNGGPSSAASDNLELACSSCGRVVPITANEYPDVKGNNCPECDDGVLDDAPEPVAVGDVSEKSLEECEKLEPAAWAYTCSKCDKTVFTRSGTTIARKCPHHHPYDQQLAEMVLEEPLVRLSDVVSLLENVKREVEAYTTAEEDPVTAFKHGSEFVLSNIRERLEEFTQKGEKGE